MAIDHARFQPRQVSDAFYQHENLKKKARYLLYVGSDAPRKNLCRLIEAFALLSAHDPHLKLLKVGGGKFVTQRKEVEAMIQKYGSRKYTSSSKCLKKRCPLSIT